VLWARYSVRSSGRDTLAAWCEPITASAAHTYLRCKERSVCAGEQPRSKRAASARQRALARRGSSLGNSPATALSYVVRATHRPRFAPRRAPPLPRNTGTSQAKLSCSPGGVNTLERSEGREVRSEKQGKEEVRSGRHGRSAAAPLQITHPHSAPPFAIRDSQFAPFGGCPQTDVRRNPVIGGTEACLAPTFADQQVAHRRGRWVAGTMPAPQHNQGGSGTHPYWTSAIRYSPSLACNG
jgi:hypothetical protein